MNAAREATACLSTSFLSLVMLAFRSPVLPLSLIVLAAIFEATSTSNTRQFTVEVTDIIMLSAEVAWMLWRSSV